MLVLAVCWGCSSTGVSQPTEQTQVTAKDVSGDVASIPASSGESLVDDEAAIVVAVVRERLKDPNGPSQPVTPDVVNIVAAYAFASESGFLDQQDEGTPIGPAVRAAVEEALSPAIVGWVENRAEAIAAVGNDQEGAASQIVFVLTLSAPTILGTQAEMTSEMYCGFDCAVGGMYELERDSTDGWYVASHPGPTWVT